MSDTNDSILWAVDAAGTTATITMNRPAKLNALDPDAYEAMRAALHRFDQDPQLRVAILTGTGGRAFSTGSDMKTGSWLATDDQPLNVTEFVEPPLPKKPVIAAIDGYALGGGLEWALRCDIRIATSRSSFGLPEPRWGTLAGYGLHYLSRHVSPGDALYMQLTGDRIDAERALRIGLIQEIVDPDALLTRAAEIAGSIIMCSPMAVDAIKATVDFGMRRGIDDSYAFVKPMAEAMAHSEDAHEGPRAFAEKRQPQWKRR